jgi:hypothetical protein
MRSGSDTSRAIPRRHYRVTVSTLAIGLLFLCGASSADSLYVICNPAVALSQSDLRDVFLGEKQFSGRVRLAPADNRAAQATFLEKVLMMSAAKYSTSWIKKSFRDGVNPLPVKGSDAETLAYVRREKGGCSYVTIKPGPGVVVVSGFTT